MTAEPETAAILEAVLAVLSEEEDQLGRLLGLALDEQRALVTSNITALEEITPRMLELSDGLDQLEARRMTLLSGLADGDETLAGLLPLAGEVGVDGLEEARARMIDAAARLQRAQESNARLIMAAMRLGERWMNLMTGTSAPTYEAAGRRQAGRSRGLISRSA